MESPSEEMEVDFENIPCQLEVKGSTVEDGSQGTSSHKLQATTTLHDCEEISVIFSGVFCRKAMLEGDKFGPMEGERVAVERPNMNFDLVFKVSCCPACCYAHVSLKIERRARLHFFLNSKELINDKNVSLVITESTCVHITISFHQTAIMLSSQQACLS